MRLDGGEREMSVRLVRSLSLLVLILIFNVSVVIANVSTFSACRWDPESKAISLVGDRAYVSKGERLIVFDISEPTAPVLLAQCMISMPIRAIAVKDTIAYVACDTGFYMVDCTNLANPLTKVILSPTLMASFLEIVGTNLYIGHSTGLSVMSIATPAAPGPITNVSGGPPVSSLSSQGTYLVYTRAAIVCRMDTATNTVKNSYNSSSFTYTAIAYYGSNIYAATTLGTIQIFNVPTSGAALPLASTITGPITANKMLLSGSSLYIAAAKEGLMKYDLLDPASPILSDKMPTAGTSYSLAISGDHAYIADGDAGLQVAKLTKRANPTFIGSITSGPSHQDVSVSSRYAYMASSTYLAIWDISKPTSLTNPGALNTGSVIQDTAIFGSVVLTCNGTNGYRGIDVTNPATPVQAWSQSTHANGVAKVGNLAYIASLASGLQIVDMTTPSSPVVKGSITTRGSAVRVFVDNGIAYLATSYGIEIFDVSTPALPVSISAVSVVGIADIAEKNGCIYVINTSSGYSIKVYDSFSLTLKNTYVYSMQPRSLLIDGDALYVSYYTSGPGGIDVYDISNPPCPVKTANWTTSTSPNPNPIGMAISNGYLYVADNTSGRGLDIFDINNPAILANWDDLAYGLDYSTPFGYKPCRLFAAVGDTGVHGLVFVDTIRTIFYDTGFNTTGLMDTPGCAYGVSAVIQGTNAYPLVADGECGLDFNDLLYPTLGTAWSATPGFNGLWLAAVGSNGVQSVPDNRSYNTPGYAKDIACTMMGLALVADGNAGLQILDAYSLSYRGSLALSGYANGVSVSGNTAYVACGTSGLQIVDITSPKAPVLLGRCDTPGYSYDVSVWGNYAFVADGTAGIQVIDITDPASPVIVASFDTPGSARGIEFDGFYAYVADYNGGISVIQIGLYTPFLLYSVTPKQVGNNGIKHLSIYTAGLTAYNGATVKLSRKGSPSITATNVTITNSSLIDCDVNLSGAELGYWDVTVTNLDSLATTASAALLVSPVDVLSSSARLLGINSKQVKNPTLQSVISTYRFMMWGKVTEIDSNYFQISDGEKYPITVFAPTYKYWNITNSKYVSVNGTLNFSSGSPVLVSDHWNIKWY